MNGILKMRQITKNKEPITLIAYKKQVDAAYDGPHFTIVKEKIRQSLLEEQGFLCAYCMRRINIDSMKIEHWACQHSDRNQQLNYNNLLACCDGYEGSPKKKQTCDTRKNGNNIKFSPSNPEHRINNIIKYNQNGEITSTDLVFNKELNECLNLNENRLKSNRASVLKLIQKKLSEKLSEKLGKRRENEIRKLLSFYEQKKDGKYSEYYGVAVHYLQKKLHRD